MDIRLQDNQLSQTFQMLLMNWSSITIKEIVQTVHVQKQALLVHHIVNASVINTSLPKVFSVVNLIDHMIQLSLIPTQINHKNIYLYIS